MCEQEVTPLINIEKCLFMIMVYTVSCLIWHSVTITSYRSIYGSKKEINFTWKLLFGAAIAMQKLTLFRICSNINQYNIKMQLMNAGLILHCGALYTYYKYRHPLAMTVLTI